MGEEFGLLAGCPGPAPWSPSGRRPLRRRRRGPTAGARAARAARPVIRVSRQRGDRAAVCQRGDGHRRVRDRDTGRARLRPRRARDLPVGCRAAARRGTRPVGRQCGSGVSASRGDRGRRPRNARRRPRPDDPDPRMWRWPSVCCQPRQEASAPAPARCLPPRTACGSPCTAGAGTRRCPGNGRPGGARGDDRDPVADHRGARDPSGDTAVLTAGSIQAGTKSNVIPDHAVLLLNVRTYSERTRSAILNAVRRMVERRVPSVGLPERPRSSSCSTASRSPTTTRRPLTGCPPRSTSSSASGRGPMGQQTASEDFSDIPTALGVPYTYWGLGGIDPGHLPPSCGRRAGGPGHPGQPLRRLRAGHPTHAGHRHPGPGRSRPSLAWLLNCSCITVVRWSRGRCQCQVGAAR